MKKKLSQGVFAAWCQPGLQSSTEQWGMHFALSTAAVHWCWVNAHLYEEQTFIGGICTDKGLVSACLAEQH